MDALTGSSIEKHDPKDDLWSRFGSESFGFQFFTNIYRDELPENPPTFYVLLEESIQFVTTKTAIVSNNQRFQ